MRIHNEMQYDASPAEVFEMLADPAFREKVCRAQRVLDVEVRVDRDGDKMTVVVEQTHPADGIPGFAKKFVGDRIDIVQTERWSDPASAELALEIPGKPGSMSGTVTLNAEGTGTREVVEGDLRVSVPLVGGRIEGLISDLLTRAIRTEQEVGRAWLAGDR